MLIDKILFYSALPVRLVLAELAWLVVQPLLFASYVYWRTKINRKFRSMAKIDLELSAIARAQFPQSFTEYKEHLIIRAKVNATETAPGVGDVPDFNDPWFEKLNAK